jgi:predicted nucleotidyltransferase
LRPPTYPGGPEHQRLLRAIAEHYADDDRLLAVTVFGSVGRGTWDEFSDLDLDVVIADEVTLDVVDEVRLLCRGLGQQPVVIVLDRDDAADVVLASLMDSRFGITRCGTPARTSLIVWWCSRVDSTTRQSSTRVSKTGS